MSIHAKITEGYPAENSTISALSCRDSHALVILSKTTFLRCSLPPGSAYDIIVIKQTSISSSKEWLSVLPITAGKRPVPDKKENKQAHLLWTIEDSVQLIVGKISPVSTFFSYHILYQDISTVIIIASQFEETEVNTIIYDGLITNLWAIIIRCSGVSPYPASIFITWNTNLMIHVISSFV